MAWGPGGQLVQVRGCLGKQWVVEASERLAWDELEDAHHESDKDSRAHKGLPETGMKLSSSELFGGVAMVKLADLNFPKCGSASELVDRTALILQASGHVGSIGIDTECRSFFSSRAHVLEVAQTSQNRRS